MENALGACNVDVCKAVPLGLQIQLSQRPLVANVLGTKHAYNPTLAFNLTLKQVGAHVVAQVIIV